MPTSAATKPRLKNLDDLFKVEAPGSPCLIPVDNLTPFREHPFRLYDGERLEDMVESIRKKGVLIPIIVRKMGEKYEILSGHNRVNAARLAGLTEIPAIVKENLSDDEAWVYVVETNLMQRSFADMYPSERAAVIATQHSKLFSQGKRNDILREIEMLEKSCNINGCSTSVGKSQKMDTREKLAREYGLKPFSIAQYIRIHKLNQRMKRRLDNGEFAISPAVALSFLSESEQEQLDRCLELNGFSIDGKKAALLRDYATRRKLDNDSIYLILSGELGQKPRQRPAPTVKVRKDVYAKYFRPEQTATEVQGIVEKALELYFSQTT